MIRLLAQMDNDFLARRQVIPAQGGGAEWTLLNASREEGEEGPWGAGLGEVSIWMGWTPDHGGEAVLAAGSLDNLPRRMVVSHRQAEGGWSPLAELVVPGQVTFLVESGREYLIGAIGPEFGDSWSWQPGGGGTVSLAIAPLASNLSPETAVSLGSGDVEFAASCLGSPEGVRWWSWTAPADGAVVYQPHSPTGSPIFDRPEVNSGLSEIWLDPDGVRRAVSVRAGDPVLFRLRGQPWDPASGQLNLRFSALRIEFPEGPNSAIEGRPFSLRLADAPTGRRFVRCGIIAGWGASWDTPSATGDPERLSVSWTPTRVGEHGLVGFVEDDTGLWWPTAETRLTVRTPNDDVALATSMVANVPPQPVPFLGLTLEPGEPVPGKASAWWTWTAPTDGPMRLWLGQSRGGLGTATMRLFSEAGSPDLTLLDEISANDAAAPFLTLDFHAQAGRSYKVSVAMPESTRGRPGLALITGDRIQTNDLFADRMVLSGTNLTLRPRLDLATVEVREPYDRSLWYEWTAPASGELHLDFDEPRVNFITVAVYSGGTFPVLQLDRFFRPTETGGAQLPVSSGSTYWISVNALFGFRDLEAAPEVLHLSFEAALPADSFAEARTESGEIVEFTGTTARAGTEPGDPEPDRRTVWHRWTAPRTGDVILWIDNPGIFPAGSIWDRFPQVSVFAGDPLSALTLIARISSFSGQPVVFPVQEGRLYAMAVSDGMSQAGRPYLVRLQYADSLSGVDFEDALPVTNTPVVLPALHRIADPDPDAPAGLTEAFWWRWTPGASGWATLKCPGDVDVRVFSGDRRDGLDNVLTERSTNGVSHTVQFPVTSGVPYRMAAARPLQPDQPYTLRLDLTSLRFAGPEDLSHWMPGEPIPLRLAPVDESVDGKLAGASFRVTLTASDFSQLIRTVPVNDPTWMVTNALPLGEIRVTASLTNEQGMLRTSRPLRLFVQHAQDAFASAPVMTGPSWSQEYLFNTATREAGEPDPGPWAEAGSLWWHWVALYSGESVIEHSGAALQVFTGPSVEALSPVELQPYPGDVNRMTFRARRGTAYRIRLEGYRAMERGTISLWAAPLSLDSPETGFIPVGPSLTLRADADEALGITQIDFLLDGVLVASAHGPPWQIPAPLLGAGSGNLLIRGRLPDSTWITNRVPSTLRWKEPNDDLANATLLEGSPVSVSAFTQFASREEGEASHAVANSDVGGTGTLWWRYHAAVDGALWIQIEGNERGWAGRDLSPFFAVYDLQGTRLAMTERQAGGARTNILIQSGEDYWMAVAATAAPSNRVSLHLEAIPRVAHDRIDSAQEIAGFPARLTVPAGTGTLEPGELWTGSCAAGGSYWWHFTAPADGHLAVNRGVGCIQVLSTPQDMGTSKGIPVSAFLWYQNLYPVRAGRGYWIGLAEDRWIQGLSELSVSFVPATIHDAFAQARSVLNSEEPILMPATVASLESGEPSHPGADAIALRGSLWASWLAPGNGVALVRAEGVARLVVYRGDRLETLRPIAAGVPPLNFTCRAGESYSIAMLVGRETSDFVNLSVVLLAGVPPNDDFENAERLRGTHAMLTARIGHATRELGEPVHAKTLCGRSCWWEWKAPISGPVHLAPNTWSHSPFSLAVYRGDPRLGLREVAAAMLDTESSALGFDALEGETYRIAADGVGFFGDEIDVLFQQVVDGVRFRGGPGRLPFTLDLEFLGQFGSGYRVEESGDLKTWTPVRHGSFSGDFEVLSVPISPDVSTRFLRMASGSPNRP